jgi:uncharacterized protein (DUF1697 family)
MPKTEKWAALLRGINVGRNRRLAMADLRRTMSAEGLTDVRTLLQSGNAVFAAAGYTERKLVARLEAAIERDFGYDLTVVVRPAAEVAGLPAANPFLAAGRPVSQLHVLFPAARPTAAALDALAGEESGDDEFELVGRDVHLCLPNGVAGSRLTYEVLGRHLGPGTVRNWNTTMKLVDALAD